MSKGGAPKGNRNAAKAKVWTAAIERALDRRKPANERIKAIDELADKLIDQCLDGSLAALQELGNRLEGKASQSVEHTGQIDHMNYDVAVMEMLSERGAEPDDTRRAEPTTH